MNNIQIENRDGLKGVMSVRQNEVHKIVHFMFEDGSEDSVNYSKRDSDDYIVDDL